MALNPEPVANAQNYREKGQVANHPHSVALEVEGLTNCGEDASLTELKDGFVGGVEELAGAALRIERLLVDEEGDEGKKVVQVGGSGELSHPETKLVADVHVVTGFHCSVVFELSLVVCRGDDCGL